MPVPKYRTSSSKRDKRRSHHALTPKSLSFCSHCDAIKLPHTVCPSCGFYKNRHAIDVPGHDHHDHEGHDHHDHNH